MWDEFLATSKTNQIVETPNLFHSDGLPRNNETLIWSTAAAAAQTSGFPADSLNRIASNIADTSSMPHIIVSGSLATDNWVIFACLDYFSNGAGMVTTLYVPTEQTPVRFKKQMKWQFQLFRS